MVILWESYGDPMVRVRQDTDNHSKTPRASLEKREEWLGDTQRTQWTRQARESRDSVDSRNKENCGDSRDSVDRENRRKGENCQNVSFATLAQVLNKAIRSVSTTTNA